MYSMSTLKSQKRSTFVKLCFAMCLLTISAATAHAATFTVTNTNDSGLGSLRQAIAEAHDNGGGSDSIVFDTAGVFAVLAVVALLVAIGNATLDHVSLRLTRGSPTTPPYTGGQVDNGQQVNILQPACRHATLT